MRVVKVIHGYPMRYNAGSEVYSQTLCHGLVARGHHVHVFTREDDSFAANFSLRHEFDADDSRVKLHITNISQIRDRYRVEAVDRQFAALLDEISPDIVHIGHLNHLSTSLVGEARRRGIPIVYTLHDYWIMCPRGQLMQMNS
ncbi:MAG TPA: radical SAM protein, partial [Nannocystis exedens]|nr:radical SAM protein [Nannocystis exedens]